MSEFIWNYICSHKLRNGQPQYTPSLKGPSIGFTGLPSIKTYFTLQEKKEIMVHGPKGGCFWGSSPDGRGYSSLNPWTSPAHSLPFPAGWGFSCLCFPQLLLPLVGKDIFNYMVESYSFWTGSKNAAQMWKTFIHSLRLLARIKLLWSIHQRVIFQL